LHKRDEMKIIKFVPLMKEIRQIFVKDERGIKGIQLTNLNRETLRRESEIPASKVEAEMLASMIMKYETDVRTLCEIVEDNVSEG
jgi:hypothetical protein